MIQLSPERPEHAAPIEALLDNAFGPDRTLKQSYAYRRDVAALPELGLVALNGDILVGTIRYWPVVIGRSVQAALLLGPVAVDPSLQKSGIGRQLIERSLSKAQSLGHERVLLVGDPGYYERFGFAPAAAQGIMMPGEQPHRLLLRALVPHALATTCGGPLWPWTPDLQRKIAATA
ncbi:N-acetyltransferase [Magnetospira thiophila]